jgi:hypothetical protein
MFSFQDCNFAIQKSKETCGRVVMFREFNILNSFTLEASFLGPTKGCHGGLHFNTGHMQMIGRVFCQTLADTIQDPSRIEKAQSDLNKAYP